MATYPGGRSIFDAPVISGVPADADRVMIMNNSATLLGYKTYEDIKGYFIKTYADSQVDAHTTWADNYKAKFGTTGQMQLWYDTSGGKTKIENTVSNMKLDLITTGTYPVTVEIDPADRSIAIGANTVVTPTTASLGWYFDSTGRTVFQKDIIMGANIIRLGTGYVNYDGTAAVGMSVDSNQDFTFSNNVSIVGNLTITGELETNGLLDLNAHMATGTYNISYTGVNGTGLEFDSINQATFNQHLDVKDEITCDGLNSSQDIYCGSYIESYSYIRSGSTIDLDHGQSTPSTVTGKARLWVDSSKNLKIKHSDGTINTITVT